MYILPKRVCGPIWVHNTIKRYCVAAYCPIVHLLYCCRCQLHGLGAAFPYGDGGAAGRVGAVAVWRQGERWGGSLGAGAGERRQGKVDAAVEGVLRRYQGGRGATVLLGWEGGSGCSAVLARRQWRGGMTMVAGVSLRCWGGGGTVWA
jgi:hypothetical protein